MDAKTAWTERQAKDREVERSVTELLLKHLREARETQMTGVLNLKLSMRLGGVSGKRVIVEIEAP